MSALILATEASLSTLEVSVRALIVGGKQMTLSVFRQLPSATPIYANGDLLPYRWWGYVRYRIGDEGTLWAVADVDGHLVRCQFEPEIYPEHFRVYEIRKKEELAEARARGNAEWARKLELDIASLPWEKNRNDSCRKLAALPQLFIAV